MSLYQDRSGSGLKLQGDSSAADTYHIVEVIFPARRERNNYTEYSDATKTGEKRKAGIIGIYFFFYSYCFFMCVSSPSYKVVPTDCYGTHIDNN